MSYNFALSHAISTFYLVEIFVIAPILGIILVKFWNNPEGLNKITIFAIILSATNLMLPYLPFLL